ncbi:hypothetical protein Q0N88_07630 [Bacillus thuringiensis]|uniref:hypothetical protein n=1 Tax=Bacillus thuringiensis TaxID=1428 RepID=UPI0027E8F199|nr:hypothetical protein [Bacillus cereus]
MDIQEVSRAVQAIRAEENENGILSIRGNEVHLSNETFEWVLGENSLKPNILSRKSEKLPYEVSFINDNVIYYSLYTSERLKEKLGGIPHIRKCNDNRKSS